MKQKHTQAKKANRSSAYSKVPSFRGQSEERRIKRMEFQPAEDKCFGRQIQRSQAIEISRGHVKTIYHTA